MRAKFFHEMESVTKFSLLAMIEKLKTQLQVKKEKAEGSKGRQFHSEAKFLMLMEALATWVVEKKEKVEKERVEKEKLEAKTALEKGNEERHAQLTHNVMIHYRRSLKSKCKAELEDIACLLWISFTPKTTNSQHANAIVAHLAATPELADDL